MSIEEIKSKIIQIQKYLDELKTLVNKLETNRCFLCNGSDHISKDCIDTQPETEDDRDYIDVEEDDSDTDEEDYKPFFCYRCGRRGHYSIQCYAKTHINGDDLDSFSDHYHSE